MVVPIQSRLNRSVLNSELLLKDLEPLGVKLHILSSGKTLNLGNEEDKFIYRLNAALDNRKTDSDSAISSANHAYKRSRFETCLPPFGY